MSSEDIVLTGRMVTMDGGYRATDLMLKSAVVKEGLSKLTETTIEFLSRDRKMVMEDVVGYTMSLHIETYQDGELRHFHGTCVAVEYLGLSEGFSHFSATVRPWLWFLTRTADCKIFQEMDVTEIIKEVFGDAGFSDYKMNTSGSYAKRTYCVQYRETDFDFISRLMEEEGIYYYFDHLGSIENMIIVDDSGGHPPMQQQSEIEFFFREADYRRRDDHIFEWTSAENVTRGKVTLNDYNFETPTADLKVATAIRRGAHSHGTYEVYDYPGHYRQSSRGEARSRVRMQAEAIGFQRVAGVGNMRTMTTGRTFKLKNHPRDAENRQYMVTDAVHHIQIETDYEDADQSPNLLGDRLEFAEENRDTYRCVFGAVPKSEQYRAPLTTPWPEIPGMHTALVVGKSGEEIYTDKYGRIKVQFHWDRLGNKNEKSSCWVRTVMPWTGNAWGMIAVPRMGQEVVIQFEEGDPDRPICTGMLYNQATMPPYNLPENQTKSGIKTNSSKGGGGFNELMFEDKKGAELVRFQAEKDYEQIIKNNATITIGMEKMDAGDLTQTVYNHQTETIKEGNHTFTIEKGDQAFTITEGSQVIEIKTDKDEHIEGSKTLIVDGDVTETIKEGSHTFTISEGSQAIEIMADKDEHIEGNKTLTVDGDVTETIGENRTEEIGGDTTETVGGDVTQEAGGKIEIIARTSITLRVGSSSIKLEQSGVTIRGGMISVDGSGMVEVKGSLTTVKADGMLTLKGGITMIN